METARRRRGSRVEGRGLRFDGRNVGWQITNSRRGVAASCSVPAQPPFSKRIANWGTLGSSAWLRQPQPCRAGETVWFATPNSAVKANRTELKVVARGAPLSVWLGCGFAAVGLVVKSDQSRYERQSMQLAKEGREVRQGLRRLHLKRLGAIGRGRTSFSTVKALKALL